MLKEILIKIKRFNPFEIDCNGILPKVNIGTVKIPYQKIYLWKLPIPVPYLFKVVKTPEACWKKENYKLRSCLDNKTFKKKRLEEIYCKRMGRHPNLDNPTSLTEKINYLKLYYEDNNITICCDKYRVKEYVGKTVGYRYCVPNIGVWKNEDEINFDVLPDSFVLKVNWSSGYNIVIKNKAEINNLEKSLMKEQIGVWLRPESNSYYDAFNWGYKNMEPIVYAEEYLPMEADDDEYKVFCFNGKAVFTLIEKFDCKNINSRVCVDSMGKEMDFTIGNKPKAKTNISANYFKMIEVAEKLAAPFVFVRVDFIQVGKRIYVGEMTFYSGGGFSKFNPPEWDYKLGDLLEL